MSEGPPDALAGTFLPAVDQPFVDHAPCLYVQHSWTRKLVDMNLDRIRVFDECRCGVKRSSCYAFRYGEAPKERDAQGRPLGAWGPVRQWTSATYL